jgi:S-(hydroxymethyl)glutathione dehydrogenase/alcohol dehydrogenase
MKVMLAAITLDRSKQFELVEIPIPTPGKDEALIKVLSSGVCHSDLHVLKDEVKFPRPAVLGHEVMGEVIEKLDPENRFPEIEIGNLVISSFIMPCKKCSNCESGSSNLCSEFFLNNRVNGNMLDGTRRLKYSNGDEIASYSMAGFAEYAVVPLSALANTSRKFAKTEWCVLGCAGVTAYSAVKKAMQKNNYHEKKLGNVTIIGLGGVGIFMTLFSKLLGAEEITAIDLDNEKLTLAKDLGATKAFNVSGVKPEEIKNKYLASATNVVFEAVGSPTTLEMAMEFVAEGGQVIAVGIAPHGSRAAVEITPLVRREFTLRGSFGGIPERDLREVIDLAERGEIPLEKMVTQKYSLKEINRAFQSLNDKQTLGRSIIDFTSRKAL